MAVQALRAACAFAVAPDRDWPYCMGMSSRATTCVAVFVALVFSSAAAAAQDQTAPRDVTHGGYGAFAGGLSLSLLGGLTVGFARAMYAPPLDANCTLEPQRCRATTLDHLAVGLVSAAAVAGVVGAGYGGQKLAEHLELNPVTGWALAGGYLGLPATLLLQNVIPRWQPDWSRDLTGVVLGAGGSVGAAFAFAAIARHETHAWPEFGFGAGGLGMGLALGTLVAPNTVWVPILGGLGAVIGATAATVAF